MFGMPEYYFGNKTPQTTWDKESSQERNVMRTVSYVFLTLLIGALAVTAVGVNFGRQELVHWGVISAPVFLILTCLSMALVAFSRPDHE